MNLVTNARDATNDRHPGKCALKTIHVRAEALTLHQAPWVRLTVEDNGGGVPDEAAPRIFDPFFTTKDRDRGTGLGLYISYGIVREHGGEIHFENLPGKGTRFLVDLPVAGPPPAESPAKR